MRKGKRGRKPTQHEMQVAWEGLCDGCGKCCAIAPSKDGRNAGNGVACPSLDTTTNQCKHYKKRLSTEMCLQVTPRNVNSLHKIGVLPDSCAYVRLLNGKTPTTLGKWTGLEPAKLIPFDLANPDLASKYLLRREEWLSNEKKCPDGDR